MPTDTEKVEYLLSLLTPARAAKMVSVAAGRTTYVGLGLEDIYQPHNASAVLRSADAFGIQNVHVVEARYGFDLSRHVARGGQLWTDMHRYASATECMEAVRAAGHCIVATTPGAGSCTPANLDLSQPVTVFIGTEKLGLSEAILDAAQHRLHVPMRGFSESLNLSVCAAIIVQQLVQRLSSEQPNSFLDSEAQTTLLLRWLMADIEHADVFLARRWGNHTKAN